MATHKVGGEVDAFCTKCRLTLAHTILAMMGTKIARVRCNTCGGDHAYRAAPGSTARPSAPRAPRAKADKADKVLITFQEQLAGRDLSQAKIYSPRETFTVDQLVSHPTFGYGLVTAVRGDKVDIAFKGQQKTLVHGRGGAPAEKPAFKPPSAASTGPADKPVLPGSEPDADDASSEVPPPEVSEEATSAEPQD